MESQRHWEGLKPHRTPVTGKMSVLHVTPIKGFAIDIDSLTVRRINFNNTIRDLW